MRQVFREAGSRKPEDGFAESPGEFQLLVFWKGANPFRERFGLDKSDGNRLVAAMIAALLAGDWLARCSQFRSRIVDEGVMETLQQGKDLDEVGGTGWNLNGSGQLAAGEGQREFDFGKVLRRGRLLIHRPCIVAEVPAYPELLLLDWLRGCGRGRWRCAWLCGWGQHESLADQSETLLWEFGLKKLVVGAGKQVSVAICDGGDQVVNDDGLVVQGSLLVGVGGQLNWLNGARLPGKDGPQTGVVAGDGDGEQGFKRAGVEVGHENRARMRSQPGGGAVPACRDVDQNLRCRCSGDRFRRADHVDCLRIDDGAQLDVAEVVGRRKEFCFGQGVVETRHGDADQGS